jgi:regulatory protein
VAEREDAVEVALRALHVRDRTAAELDARLAARGVDAEERAEALARLERAGYLDDDRFARLRAEQLAGRGSGDALIRHDLEGRGVAAEHVDAALAALEPERERAARIVARRGPGPKTARYLASRGFGEEALVEVVARQD